MIEEPPKLTVHRTRRRPTDAQLAAFRGAPTGMVCDAMEGKGALSPAIRPLFDRQPQVAGVALTAEQGPSDILGTAAALAFVQPDDVLVVGTQGYQGCAAVGDRIAGMARNGGAVALVTDGPVRDAPGIRDTLLPVWCTGLNPNSPYTTGPATVGGGMAFGGQVVRTGDIVVADGDGVVVVPFDRIERTIAALARVRAAESALDAEVAAGLKYPRSIDALLEGPDTRFVD